MRKTNKSDLHQHKSIKNGFVELFAFPHPVNLPHKKREVKKLHAETVLIDLKKIVKLRKRIR